MTEKEKFKKAEKDINMFIDKYFRDMGFRWDSCAIEIDGGYGEEDSGGILVFNEEDMYIGRFKLIPRSY